MTLQQRQTLFNSLLPAVFPTGAAPISDAGYALPDAVLGALQKLVIQANIERVFEYGSGQSTRLFLAAGCDTTAIEDSLEWMQATDRELPDGVRQRLTLQNHPLQTVFDRGVPFKSWHLKPDFLMKLKSADLVLIDSPAYPPFREYALLQALRNAPEAIIIMDDANIPTVQRFCRRITNQNALLAHQSTMGHGLFIVSQLEPNINMLNSRGIVEFIKAWRRFLLMPNA